MPHPAPSSETGPKPIRSLVVDDDIVARMILVDLLRPFGPVDQAVHAIEATAAVDAAQASGLPYRLICVDIGLPTIDGCALVRQIRQGEQTRQVWGSAASRILVVSARNDSQTVLTAFRNGADGFLVKPWDAERMHAKLIELRVVPVAPP
jgi:two-component system chemotaxis response regulator CheY